MPSEYVSLLQHHITKHDVRNVGYCVIDFQIADFKKFSENRIREHLSELPERLIWFLPASRDIMQDECYRDMRDEWGDIRSD